MENDVLHEKTPEKTKTECLTKRNVTAICSGCGDLVQGLLHVPAGVGGWFCSACCPVCRPQGQDADEREPVEVICAEE